MSSPENPEVIQGRLGWESGDISEADPENLEPHPKNQEIYGDTETAADLDETFKESVAEKGVLEPMVITEGKQIVSGHRRWLAAKAAGLDSVPVRYTEFDSDLAEREALVEFNRQREKTPGQIVKEAEEILEIERERGTRRMSEGGSGGVEGSSDLTNLGRSDEHDSWEKAAKKVDVGSTSLKKGKKVKDKAESDDEPDPVREAAQEAWDKLESGEETFNGAYSQVKEAERKLESEPETETPELPDETYRAVVIDPPWNLEKIGRDERPEQGKYLDYPTLSLEELHDLPVGDLCADSGAHVYLWTTHKHLPDALELFDSWGVRYECQLTWDKQTGVAPFSWQYNTEHVLFGRFGDGLELEQRGLQLSFSETPNQHSEKPTEFFDRVREASPTPRLEMFARGSRSGFDVWGDET